MDDIRVCVDLADRAIPFRHFYSAVGYANADYTYTAPSRRMFRYLSSYHNHFRYMRVHNILTCHGRGDHYIENEGSDYGNPPVDPATGAPRGDGWDSVVRLDEDGILHFDWTVPDRVYDIFREHGMIPIVEACWMPTCLAKSPKESYIPKDMHLWHETIRAFTEHFVERYGIEEVRQWYFEVWNEPNQKNAWREHPDSFFAMYDYFAHAIHSVDPELKVGGPAVMQDEDSKILLRRFLDHCTDGVNYVTGKFGTRLDFISVHCKGGWYGSCNPSSDVMFSSVRSYLEILNEYPSLKNVEFFNDESDIVWDGNFGIWFKSWLNFRNTHYAPGYICKMIDTYARMVEDEFGQRLGIIDSDNCHIHWEKYLFSGNRSQLTPLVKRGSADLIKKSIFNAYVLMSRLGNERFRPVCSDPDLGSKFGVLPTRDGKILSLMAWNFEDGMDDEINARTLTIRLENTGLSGSYRLVHYRIDKNHSNAYQLWQDMGRPDSPDIEQIKEIRKREGLEQAEPVREVLMNDEMTFSVDLPMHAVSLLLLVPENEEAPAPVAGLHAIRENGFNGNHQVLLTWTPSCEKDFLCYRVLRSGPDGSIAEISGRDLNTALFVDMTAEKNRTYTYRVISVNASGKESMPLNTVTV